MDTLSNYIFLKYNIMWNQAIIEILSTAVFIFVVVYTKHFLAIGVITALLIYLSDGTAMFNPAIVLVNVANRMLSIPQAGLLIFAELIGAVVGLMLYKFT